MKLSFSSTRNIMSLTASICLVVLLIMSPFAQGDKSASASGHKGDKGETAPATMPASLSGMPRVALDSGSVLGQAQLFNAGNSGAGVLRLTLGWSTIEPSNTTPAQFNWAGTDNTFINIKTKGLIPLVTIGGCPAWACPNEKGPVFDNMMPELVQFMQAMAQRYKQTQFDVHLWEMWNEPDFAAGANRDQAWGPYPNKYAAMLASVYPAVKSVDANASILLGGLAYDNWYDQGGPFNPNFLPDLLTAGGANNLDAIMFHYYTNNAHGWTNISLKAAQIQTVLNQRGVRLPMVCSETGLTSSTQFGSSEAIQARYLVQMFARSAAAGLISSVWYLNQDFVAHNPGWEVFAQSGITRLDDTIKPSFTTMQVFSQKVGSQQFLRALSASDGMAGGLVGYRFAGSAANRNMSVVWNGGTGQATYTMPVRDAGNIISVKSLYGQTLTVTPNSDGTATIQVGNDPIYLETYVTRFSDVTYYSWMYQYVEYLASRGIVSGYSDGTFRPNDPATRAQFAKMVVLGNGWPINVSGGPHFADVPSSSALYTYIETASHHSLIAGYSCGQPGEPCPGTYFRPNSQITRGQIAKMIVLSRGWTLVNPDRASFSDVPRGSVFYTYVETAVSRSVVSGYSDGTFHPNANATRAQLSKMLALSLQQP